MRTGSRGVGFALGALVGAIAAFLPLAEWWDVIAHVGPIPGGIAATVGAAAAGYWVAPQLPDRLSASATIALRFALAMFLVGLPLVVIDAAVVGSRPLDEDWPIGPGPLIGAFRGLVVNAPLLAIVALVAAPIWTVLLRVFLEWNDRRSSTPHR